ncbi:MULTISPECIES: hypothetical protein [Paenibacillus]|uniref:hypothetical protein n=1 Tax=Paenibacillus TaxID=44249 RepID=UPI0007BF1EC3|nr:MULTISPECIES: hypothetical protein [Paenibacillus]MCZ1269313.1 hypothetical protein [Paenibacillus tundrae]SDK41955.1 hypothetical protein SAMN05428961_10227 [Paenibacillus sp. OK060]SEA62308.1 hypothetical protein SAMN03159332_1993 [Paenibacillus sp. 276b]SHN59235.1 hypothetical protein SAMN04487896_1331 [Paenibacillus sp. ov031]
MYAIRVGSSVQRYRYSGEARGDFAARMIAVFRPDGTLLVEGQFADQANKQLEICRGKGTCNDYRNGQEHSSQFSTRYISN